MNDLELVLCESKDDPSISDIYKYSYELDIESFRHNKYVEVINGREPYVDTVKRINKNMDNDDFYYYLLVVKGINVGFISIALDDKAIHISELYIVHNHQRKGYGKYTIRSVVDKHKADIIAINVFDGNDITVSLYRKLGFKMFSHSMAMFPDELKKRKIVSIHK